MGLKSVPGGWVMPMYYRHVSSSIVDGDKWHRIVGCDSSEFLPWMRKQDNTLWVEVVFAGTGGLLFDVHDKLYTLMTLRWG